MSGGVVAQRNCLGFLCRVEDRAYTGPATTIWFWYRLKGGNWSTSCGDSHSSVQVQECTHGVSLAPLSMPSRIRYGALALWPEHSALATELGSLTVFHDTKTLPLLDDLSPFLFFEASRN